jgi:hypothetical protein
MDLKQEISRAKKLKDSGKSNSTKEMKRMISEVNGSRE